MPPDFSGRWAALIDESRFVSRTPAKLTAEIAQSADRLRVEMRVSFEGSDDSRMTYEANIVAADQIRPGSVAQARWMGDDLIVETRIESRGGELLLRDRWWLSADGERLTMAHKDDALAGQTVVFEKQKSNGH